MHNVRDGCFVLESPPRRRLEPQSDRPMTDTTFEKKSTVPLDVLLVEDNQADVELCLRELKKAGFATPAQLRGGAGRARQI